MTRMRPSFRKFIALITLLFVLGQGVAFAFHNHSTDHAHDPAKSCAICQIAQTSKATLTSPELPNRLYLSFSQNLIILNNIEAITIASKCPPSRAPPLA